MKILLTGASSFTGVWFAGKLAEAGHQVVAPLRGTLESYGGVRGERVRWLKEWAEVAPNCVFGGPAFLELVAARDFDVLCHHAAEVRDYRSADFDVPAALAANTLNLRRVLQGMAERGLKAVIATGSVFEPDEGAGPAPRRAFSPYGLSKKLTFDTIAYWGEVLKVPVSKFVVANPFGPFEEARFVAHAVETWAKGGTLEVRTPRYLRDNIHVDLLASAYASFVIEAGAGGAGRRFGPCGYMETQGAFAERLARELGSRLGFEAAVELKAQTEFAEPLARVNTDVIDPAVYGWSEERSWDALANFYKLRGFVGAGKPVVPTRVAKPEPAAPPVELQGAIDIADHSRLSGWLTDRNGANPRFVRVVVDGVEQGTIRADIFRPDLRDLKISDGHSAYRFPFATSLDPYHDHVIRVEDRDSGRSFGPPPVNLKRLVGGAEAPFPGDREFAAVNVATAIYDSGGVTILLDLFGRAAEFGLPASEDADFEAIDSNRISHRYWDTLGIGTRRARIRARPKGTSGIVTLRFPEAAGFDEATQVVCANIVPAWLPDYVHAVAKENMERVSGPGESPGRFVAGGLATAYRIDALTRLHFGRGLAECGRCLDWGAGPGRVAVPMAETVAPGVAMTATDVDGFNVAFGKATFPEIEFVDAPFMPPLPFPDGSFGAIYGVSVFTHLTESVQFAWLAELRRLVTPGAPVIVSVHGDFASLDTAQHHPGVVQELVTRGISDVVYDHNLGPKLKEKNYYRATFHARRYILENWSRDFDVLNVYTCANGATQDFVVLRAK